MSKGGNKKMSTPVPVKKQTTKQFSKKQLELAKAIRNSAGILNFSKDFDSVAATNELRGK